MLRSWTVRGAWLVIAGVIGLSVWMLVPRMIAQYFISRLASPDKTVADASFDRLKQMGRAAIPYLIESVANGTPVVAEMRRKKITNLNQLKEEFELHFQTEPYLCWPGPDERRMDLCAILLINRWDDKSLTDEHKQVLLRYLFEMHLASSIERYSANAEPFRIARLSRNVITSVGLQFRKIYWEYSLLIRSGSNKISKSHGNYSRNSSIMTMHEVKSVYEQKPKRELATRLDSVSWNPGELKPGNYEIFYRVAVKATTKPGQTQESLNEYELHFGPIRLEIIDDSAINQNGQ